MNYNKYLSKEFGFTLIEVLMVIIVLGILASVAMQSMTASLEDMRRLETEREMDVLSDAIVGNHEYLMSGHRVDFGYAGDIGAFPPNLQALIENPGGYATWNGPYLPAGFLEDSLNFIFDEWGTAYSYTGGTTISSLGGETAITKNIANAESDYLINQFNGYIKDWVGDIPGADFFDSIDIMITIPNGLGGTQTKTYNPDSTGLFTLDTIPVGTHPLRLVYIPQNDTVFRFLTIFPRHKSTAEYRFANSYFSGSGSGGSLMLRPNGPYDPNLPSSGCFMNYQCVNEITADDDNSYIASFNNNQCIDIYELDDPAEEYGSITGLTIHYRAKKEGNNSSSCATQVTISISSVSYSVSYYGVVILPTPMYEYYSHQWVENPLTNAPWRWTEITELRAGISLIGKSSEGVFCTQFWVEVEYE